MTTVSRIAGRSCFSMGNSLRQTDGGYRQIDELDTDKRDDDAANTTCNTARNSCGHIPML